jgi:hypothetical protein
VAAGAQDVHTWCATQTAVSHRPCIYGHTRGLTCTECTTHMCKNRRIMHALTRVRLPRGGVVTTADTAHGRCGKQQCAQSDWGIPPTWLLKLGLCLHDPFVVGLVGGFASLQCDEGRQCLGRAGRSSNALRMCQSSLAVLLDAESGWDVVAALHPGRYSCEVDCAALLTLSGPLQRVHCAGHGMCNMGTVVVCMTRAQFLRQIRL